jgi:hypothetical protein
MRTEHPRVMGNKSPLNQGREQEPGLRVHSCKEENIMRCNRCGGIMIYEKFYGDCEHFFGWRCVVCGEIIDQVILENRLVRIQ